MSSLSFSTTPNLCRNRPSLSSSTPLIVKIRLEGVFNKSKRIQINRQDLISNVNERGSYTFIRVSTGLMHLLPIEYRKIVNGIEVVIGFIPSQAVEVGPFVLFFLSVNGNSWFGYLGKPFCER